MNARSLDHERRQRHDPARDVALAGALSVVWGVLLALAPVAGILVLTWGLGAYALVFGGTLLGLAYRLRQRRTAEAAATAVAAAS